MDAAKIRLSPEEAALVVSADWILTKNRVMQKAMDMLGLVQADQNIHLEKFKNRLPQAIYQSSPKIARGENYLGLPWLMLDFPRSFNREDTFAIRTFFWWGNFFSVTLHLSGIHKNAYEGAVINNFEKLKSGGFFFCVNTDQWQHHFGSDNYTATDKIDPDAWPATIGNADFIKLSKKIPLQDWNEAPQKLLKVYGELLNAIIV